jgi:hypothetical protein
VKFSSALAGDQTHFNRREVRCFVRAELDSTARRH